MGPDEPFSSGRILIVAAHPDDEVIGAGAHLRGVSGRVDIVHATNGSPENPADAQRAGLPTREQYAEVRRRELLAAVALAGIGAGQCHEIGLTDQRASFHLFELTHRILDFTVKAHPAVVLTHSYEGGHPDHDACAFSTNAAVSLARRNSNLASVSLWEFTSYHAGPAGMESGVFIPCGGSRELRYPLDSEQRNLKRRMFDCFDTQQHVLAPFGLESEAFRPAPHYDFTQPPHPGRLHYEQFDWGLKGSRWRELAGEALNQLGLQLHATYNS